MEVNIKQAITKKARRSNDNMSAVDHCQQYAVAVGPYTNV